MKNISKRLFIIISLFFVLISCSDWLEVDNKNIISNEALLSTDEGIEAYIATFYYYLPIEDFMYYFSNGGFRYTGNIGGEMNASVTQDMIHSEWGNFDSEDQNAHAYWGAGYEYIYKINKLKEAIPTMQPSDSSMLKTFKGEAAFFTAYTYFQLAKRYGGVSIIKETQEFDGDYEAVKVARSTEAETWDYILEQCDEAIDNLPNENGKRATKWAALALKSRSMLFAASVAKFWDNAPLVGPAVTYELVGGMSDEDENNYYQACIDASAEIIRSGNFELYKANPSSTEEATENYRTIFANPQSAAVEVIFSKSYTYPGLAHSMGAWHEPNQLSKQYGGRADITLDMVDAYETIDENGLGSFDSQVQTQQTGKEEYDGIGNNIDDFIRYENPLDIFKNKDPRLAATVILPFSTWKNTKIIIQGGIVKEDKSYVWLQNEKYTKDEIDYYSLGAENESQYSGWVKALSNGTITGFLLKKFLPDGDDQNQNQVTTDYIDFRYAEVLLNYAEALVESGLTAPQDIIDAKTALNMSRHRASFTNDIEATPENVQRERRIELAVEYTRPWDNVRRRQSHEQFNGSYQRSALVPMLDLSGETPAYIFVRSTLNEPGGAKKYREQNYYRVIPGISSNGVIQNPGY